MLILSRKAGDVGIRLIRANPVFHFDRWWNPAVEDQATDRAFRIGQTRNVFVHKFAALETFTDSGRLARGRGHTNNDQVKNPLSRPC